jgi:prepilin-type N-terminal cleavage/methylation domain-containing protein
MKLQIASCRLQVLRNSRRGGVSTFNFQPSTFNLCRAFTLVEVLVVMVLLSLIVLALMAVFNSTQNAFRASVTQTDVLEGGRAAMNLIVTDLKQMTPSLRASNDAVNFSAAVPVGYEPLVQPLVASSRQRTNVLENFFILSRGNVNGVSTWYGTGYVVDWNSATAINPLYRFSRTTNAAADPAGLYGMFSNAVFYGEWTNMSHLMDGVVDLRARAFDPNGYWMTNVLANVRDVYDGQIITNHNAFFLATAWGEVDFSMFSNTLPAAVEIQLGALEDRTLQRAESIGNATVRSNYLSQQSGKVHIFRQRVSIPNVDPSAYQ